MKNGNKKSTLLLASALVLLAFLGQGCATLNSSLGLNTQPYPYSEELPRQALEDQDFEAAALDAMEGEEDIDYKWTIVGRDWRVQHEIDPAGNKNITHRSRFVWVGGPAAKAPEHGLWSGSDCMYKLLEARQEHQGGGQYGSTTFYFAENIVGPTRHRLRCETPQQLEAANPEQSPAVASQESPAE